MNINLKQAFELFSLEKEATCSEKTVKNYKHDIGYFIDFLEGDRGQRSEEIDINSIDLVDIKKYVVMLKKRPKMLNHPLQPTQNKPITNTTIRTYSRHLKVFFRYLYEDELMEKDIMKKFKMVKEEKKVIIPLFSDEVEQIQKVYNDKCHNGLRNLCMIFLMLDCGLRAGEVIRLRISDIYFNKNLIFIRPSKGNKERLVTLPTKLKRMIYRYLIMYRSVTDEQLNDLDNYKDESLFLKSKSREPINYSVIKQVFGRLKKKADIPRLKPHLLRHTFATSYILGGGDISSLRLILGHSDIKVTEKYLHISNTLYLSAGKNNIYRLDKIYFKRFYDTFNTPN